MGDGPRAGGHRRRDGGRHPGLPARACVDAAADRGGAGARRPGLRLGRTHLAHVDRRAGAPPTRELAENLAPVVDHAGGARRERRRRGAEPLRDQRAQHRRRRRWRRSTPLPAEGRPDARHLPHEHRGEPTPAAAVTAPATRIVHVQVCGNHRGTPGRRPPRLAGDPRRPRRHRLRRAGLHRRLPGLGPNLARIPCSSCQRSRCGTNSAARKRRACSSSSTRSSDIQAGRGRLRGSIAAVCNFSRIVGLKHYGAACAGARPMTRVYASILIKSLRLRRKSACEHAQFPLLCLRIDCGLRSRRTGEL